MGQLFQNIYSFFLYERNRVFELLAKGALLAERSHNYLKIFVGIDIEAGKDIGVSEFAH